MDQHHYTIIIAAPPSRATPLPDTKARIIWDPNPDCRPGTIIVHSPRNPPPKGPCKTIPLPHLTLLPYLARLAAQHGWEAIAGDPEEWAVRAALAALEEAQAYSPPWPGRLSPPLRPPPIHVWADIYYKGRVEDTLGRALQAVSVGADAIVLGGTPGGDSHGYRKALKTIAVEAPVLADPAGLVTPEVAYSLGAEGYMSLTPSMLETVPEHLRGEMVFVVIPERLGSASWRVSELLSAERKARSLGYTRIVLDPVLQPSPRPGALTGLIAAAILSRDSSSPIMLGVNNVYELLDADTTGTIALLATLAAEAGASILLASEESRKAMGSVMEARLAADLASLALHLGTPAKDYPLRLLVAKEKRPQA